jgi:hypothetical protein
MRLKLDGKRTYGRETKGRRDYLKKKGHMKDCFEMKGERLQEQKLLAVTSRQPGMNVLYRLRA